MEIVFASKDGLAVNAPCSSLPMAPFLPRLSSPGLSSALLRIYHLNLLMVCFLLVNSINSALDPYCIMYLASMPSIQPNGPPVPVQQFSFSETNFGFNLQSPENQITITIYIQTNLTNEYVRIYFPLILTDVSFCFGQMFTGSSSTVATIEFMGMLPQTFSPFPSRSSFELPNPNEVSTKK